ncbi:MAG: response regulator, partial [Thermodesulfobacteriota bacterium]
MITPSIREILDKNVSGVQIRKVAEREGFTVLSKDGISKAAKGLTTIEEVMRVAPPELEEEAETAVVSAPVPPKVQPVDETAEPVAAAPAVEAESGRTKILIVDDNIVILKVLRNILESNDYTVISATNGNEALKAVYLEKPDLIITDYMMPEMDGKQLIQKLKAQLATRYIPIIMLTSKDEVDAEVEVIDAGADDYLVKPANPKRLIARIKRLLARPVMLELA